MTFALTWGWREQDAHGHARDHADNYAFDTLEAAQRRRNQLLAWNWADDGIRLDPWVGPIIRRESRGSGVKQAELGGTIRRFQEATR